MAQKAVLNITVSPRSSRNRVVIDGSDNVKIYLTSSPVDGKANAALIGFLSKILDVAKSRIQIISGEKNKKKRLQIEAFSMEELLSRLKKG